MRIGMGELRLSPEIFWKMTPRELAAITMLEAHQGLVCPRDALETLMSQFPDN